MQTTSLRLILSWGEKPQDLDSYLVSFNEGENCIVSYSHYNGTAGCNDHNGDRHNVTLNTDNTKVSEIMQPTYCRVVNSTNLS